MRFDELCLRIPGDELRMRFHEQLTVLAGVGGIERRGLVEGLLGILSGVPGPGGVLTYIDAGGRRVTVATDAAGNTIHRYDDGSPAPEPTAQLGMDADLLRAHCCIQAVDLGLLAPDVTGGGTPPELAEARETLGELNVRLESAIAARDTAEGLRQELAALDEQLREADEGQARRRYARLLAELARLRAEAAAVRGGRAGAEADRRLLDHAGEAGRLVRRWQQADERLATCRTRFGDRERLDPRTIAEGDSLPDRVPAELDGLASALTLAEGRRDRLAARLDELAASRLPEPSHPSVVRLARADQDAVWQTAALAIESRIQLEQASLSVGGLPAEGTGQVSALAIELEGAHRVVEDAERHMEQRHRTGLILSGVSTTAALLTIMSIVWLAPVMLITAVAAALWGVAEPRVRLAQARGLEEDVLVRAGVGTYLGLHLRRIDATIDPRARDRLTMAAMEHRVAAAAWHDLAGDLDPADALALELEVRRYAGALHALSGAADEIEAVRRELEEQAEPAVSAARTALLEACAPFGIDDPTLAASMVRHQVEIGATARLQRELEVAERAEDASRTELVNLLNTLGFEAEDLPVAIGALDRALSAAAERNEARTSARHPEVVEGELQLLEERARQEHRPEWGTSVTADDAAEPDVAQLRQRRQSTAEAYATASALVPDVEHLADRRNAVERRVTVLEAAMGDSPAAAALADTGDIERYLLARLTSVRNTGPGRVPMPLLLDEPFLRIHGSRKRELLDLLERLSGRAQLVYLTDDPDVVLWARRAAGNGSVLLLEPSSVSVDHYRPLLTQ